MVALKLGHILFKNQFDFDAINFIHRGIILKILIRFSFDISNQFLDKSQLSNPLFGQLGRLRISK